MWLSSVQRDYCVKKPEGPDEGRIPNQKPPKREELPYFEDYEYTFHDGRDINLTTHDRDFGDRDRGIRRWQRNDDAPAGRSNAARSKKQGIGMVSEIPCGSQGPYNPPYQVKAENKTAEWSSDYDELYEASRRAAGDQTSGVCAWAQRRPGLACWDGLGRPRTSPGKATVAGASSQRIKASTFPFDLRIESA